MLKKALAAILIIVLLVAAGFFYKDYRDQSSAADVLRNQIKNETSQAAIASSQTQALEAEIKKINSTAAATQLSIKTANQLVPNKENSNRILEEILILGSQKDITVIPLYTQDWASAKFGQHSYQAFRMDIEVTAEEDRLLPFLQDLQNLKYQPLVIENISLEKPVPVSPIPPRPSPTNPTPPFTPTTLTVYTHTASDITETSATLNGNLALLGNFTNAIVQFEYGATASYGNLTPTLNMTTIGTFNYPLNGLAPGTTYYYRSKATAQTSIVSPVSVVYGNPMTFWTISPPVPPSPIVLSMKLSLAVYAQ